MIKTLSPIGNSLGLIIDRPILDLLGIGRETQLEITTDGKGLYIRPVETDHRTRVLETAERVMDVHEETLRKLAQ
jgi:antitoxin component of MazEF toxin-antitoxin module